MAGNGVSEGCSEDGSVSAGKIANLIQLLQRKDLLLPGQRSVAG